MSNPFHNSVMIENNYYKNMNTHSNNPRIRDSQVIEVLVCHFTKERNTGKVTVKVTKTRYKVFTLTTNYFIYILIRDLLFFDQYKRLCRESLDI